MKCIIISGLLHKLSDNIIPFLDKETDVYVHTWDMEKNSRWLVKLNRYKKYCNQIKVIFDKPFLDVLIVIKEDKHSAVKKIFNN